MNQLHRYLSSRESRESGDLGFKTNIDEIRPYLNNLIHVFEFLYDVSNPKVSNNVVDPRSILLILQEELKHVNFNVFQSNDPHEFLYLLLKKIAEWEKLCRRSTLRYVLDNDKQEEKSIHFRLANEAWNEHLKQDVSPFTDLFDGLLFWTTTCLSCKSESSRKPEKFITLEVEPHENTQSSLEKSFCCTEGAYDWTCSECKRENAPNARQCGFWLLPRVLIIHVNRFDANDRNKKIKTPMFPSPLIDVSSFTSPYRPRFWSPVYDLRSIVSHTGNCLDDGHYTAVVKHDGKWVLYDDDHVFALSTGFKKQRSKNSKKSSREDEDEDEGEEAEHTILSQYKNTCYLLAYEKRRG